MKTRRAALAACLISAGVCAAAASGAFASAVQKNSRGRAALVEKGREVYAANCARCHGADGLGRTPLGEAVEAPDLTDAAWRKRRKDSQMIASVSRGRGQMPGFARKLTREEIAAAVAYVRTLRK